MMTIMLNKSSNRMNVGNRNIYSQNSTCKFQLQSLVAIEMNMLIIIINNSFNAFL